MGLLDWLGSIFGGGDAGFIVKAGHELRWARGSRVGVFVAEAALGSMDSVMAAVRQYRAVTGGLFQFPVVATAEMRAAFASETLRKNLTGAVLVVLGPEDPTHGTSEIQSDDRTGAIRNVLVSLPPLPDSAIRDSVILHELGHCLGLAHDAAPSSVMFQRSTGRGQSLSSADAARLTKAYG
jgi:hypothetical protein